MDHYFCLGEHCGLRPFTLSIFQILVKLFGLHIVTNKLSQVIKTLAIILVLIRTLMSE